MHRIERREFLRDRAAGMFAGDECLAGKNPVPGTELCTVVEFL